jgi:hypothetical protein
VAVPAADALTRAHMLALEKLIAEEPASPLNEERRDALVHLQRGRNRSVSSIPSIGGPGGESVIGR